MSINNKLINGLVAGSVAALVMGSASVANAFSFSSSDVVEENGLEWLKLTVTKGASVSDVSAAMDGGTLDGWRFATGNEVLDTWSSFDEVRGSLGTSWSSSGGDLVYGWLGGSSPGRAVIFNNNRWREGLSTQFNQSQVNAYLPIYGSWLVRDVQPEAVPEPISGLVLAAAGGGAALRRAKNKKRSKQS